MPRATGALTLLSCVSLWLLARADPSPAAPAGAPPAEPPPSDVASALTAELLSELAGPQRRLAAALTSEMRGALLAKIAARAAALDALLEDGSKESLAAALDAAAALAALTDGLHVGDPLDQLLAEGGAEEWVDALGDVHVLGGPGEDPQVGAGVAAGSSGRALSWPGGGGGRPHAGRHRAPGHVHITEVELTSHHQHSTLARGRERRGRVPLRTSPLVAERLRTATGVPLSGFLHRGVFSFDVSHAGSRRCSSQSSGGRVACVVGNATRDVPSADDATAAVKAAWRASAAASMAEFGLLGGASGGGNARGERGLRINTGAATGTRRCFLARVKFAGTADSAAGQTEAGTTLLAGQLTALWRDQSYNALVPVVDALHACVYEITMLAADATGSSYGAIYSQLVTAAANHVDPACRTTVNSATYKHVLVLHPYISSAGYAGLAYVPGFQSWYNGPSYSVLWVVGHEAGHNWGLLHGWISDPLNNVDEEYGDQTECMASARATWEGLSYMQGEKDALGWMPPGAQLEMSPVSAVRSREYLLASTERLNATAGLSGAAYASVRAPLMDGLASNWLYLTWRGAYNRAVINGVSMHSVPFDHDIFGDPISQGTGQLGPPNLVDAAASTQDQADADLEAGNAFVYATPYSGAAQLLIETTAGRQRIPASSTSLADDVLTVRTSWLSEAGERPEGRGCAGDGGCQPLPAPALSSLPPLACGGVPVLVTLTAAERVAVLSLSAPGVSVAATVSTCSTAAAAAGAPATGVGVYTNYPSAQVVAGAMVSSGAAASSTWRLVRSGSSMLAQGCGELVIALNPSQPLYVAVAAPGVRWGGGNASYTPPASVTVAVTAVCDATRPNTNVVARISTRLAEVASAGPLLNGRAAFTSHDYPWMSSRQIYWDGSTWRVGSSEFHRRPTLSSVGSAVASTAGDPDVTAMASSTFFPACPPDLYMPYPTLGTVPPNVCAPCGDFQRANAGSSSPAGTTKCVCARGSVYNSTTARCVQCGTNKYRTAVTPLGTASTCSSCAAGKYSKPGGRSSAACSAAVCARVRVSGHWDARVNAVYNRTATALNGLPVYAALPDGSGAQALYMVYLAASSWAFSTSAAAAGALNSSYRVSSPAPPNYWVDADWPAVPGWAAPVVRCTCASGFAVSPDTGACVAVAPVVAGCAEGAAPTGAGGACVACPAFQVALGGVCACPAGYTSSATGLACSPPLALHVAETVAPGGALPPDGVLGRCVLDRVLRAAWGAYAPVYACGPSAASGGTPLAYLVPHPDRREWSFAPVATGAHSPRFGYVGDYTTGDAAALAACSGVTLPLGSVVGGLPRPPPGANSTWRFWDARTLAFTLRVPLALLPVVPPPGSASAGLSVSAMMSAAATGVTSRRLQGSTETLSPTSMPSATPTVTRSASSSPGFCAVAFTARLTGTSGLFAGNITGEPARVATGACGTAVWSSARPQALFELQLAADLAVGGTLTLSTCTPAAGFDTMLALVSACPATAVLPPCLSGNDDFCSLGSQVSLVIDPGNAGRTYYVLVMSYGTAVGTGTYSLSWSWLPPTPASTPSTSPTSTLSSGALPSISSTSSVSSSTLPSPTATVSVSRSAPPTATRSASSSPGFCAVAFTARLTGTSGSFSGNIASEPARITSGSCGSAAWTTTRPQALFELQLAADLDLNGTLTLSTCTPAAGFDTMLALVSACPATGTLPSCLAGNDDFCSLGSQVSLVINPGNAGRTYYVLVMSYDAATVAGAFTLSWSWLPPLIPSPTTTPTTTSTATLSIGALPSISPTGSLTGSATRTATGSRSATPPATQTASGTASRSATASQTASVTPTPSVTPSPTGTMPQAAFLPSNVVVVRVGDSARPATAPGAAGWALPVYIDEYNPATAGGAAVPALSVLLPSSRAAAAGGGFACTLSHGGNASSRWFSTEGFPSITSDGRALLLPCYDVPVGSVLDEWAIKPVAAVRADGSVATLAGASGTMYGSTGLAVRQAAGASTATAAIVAGSAAFGGGLRQLVEGGAAGATREAAAVVDARAVGFFGGTAYGASGAGALFTVSPVSTLLQPSGYATAPTTPAAVLPGLPATDDTLSPWGFTFQPDGATLWVADDATPGTRSVVRFTRTAGAWAQSGAFFVDAAPVRSVAGRTEDSAGGAFVLYACTHAALFRAVTSPSFSAALVASAPAGGAFRGVALAPADVRMVAASPSVTSTGSTTPGAEPSVSPSSTAALTGSPAGTPSSTGSMTRSPTASQSGSPAATRSGSPASTAGSTGSPSRSASPTGSLSATSAATVSGTPASTALGSPTSTATSSRSAPATISPNGTPAATVSPAGTPAATQSNSASSTDYMTASVSRAPTASDTSSASSAASLSGSPSAAPTTTAAASQTISPAATGSDTATPTRSGLPTGTVTPSVTRTVTPSQSGTLSRTRTPSGTGTLSATGTPSSTRSGSPMQTSSPTGSQTQTLTGSGTSTLTSSGTGAPTSTPSGTQPPTPSPTGSRSSSGAETATRSAASTATQSISGTGTMTPQPTRSGTATVSTSLTGSETGTPTATESLTSSSSATAASTVSSSGTGSPDATVTASRSASGSKTRLPSRSATPTRTRTATRTRTRTRSRTPSMTRSKSSSKKPKRV